jgi:hypothetical protein
MTWIEPFLVSLSRKYGLYLPSTSAPPGSAAKSRILGKPENEPEKCDLCTSGFAEFGFAEAEVCSSYLGDVLRAGTERACPLGGRHSAMAGLICGLFTPACQILAPFSNECIQLGNGDGFSDHDLALLVKLLQSGSGGFLVGDSHCLPIRVGTVKSPPRL